MVDLEIASGVAWLTLNRPAKLNALDRLSVRALAAHLQALRDRSDVGVVVTRGAGRAFCAGSDLNDLAPLSTAEAVAAEDEHAAACALYDLLPQPTVALLHGYVLGGGLGLALYHDFRIAMTSATLGLPEVELGWTPPWAVGRLVDVIGGAGARWLALAAERVSGQEAKAIGLVNEVFPDEQFADGSEAFIRHLAALPPAALRETKALLVQMSSLRDSRWDRAASEAFARCYATPEARASLERFTRQRRP